MAIMLLLVLTGVLLIMLDVVIVIWELVPRFSKAIFEL